MQQIDITIESVFSKVFTIDRDQVSLYEFKV